MRFKAVTFTIFVGLAFVSFMNGSTEPAIGVNVGDRAPKIESRLLDGSLFDSEALKGKMVLVDFWASYDAPSRIDNPRKKHILEQYRDSEFLNSDGFVVISVSLDRFKTPLYRTIERDGLQDFFHLCDLNGLESELAESFKVGDDFPNFLIDGEGRIVEKSSDIEKIANTLKRLESVDREHFAAYRR
ncbi:TlpA family protein disulfide reductase [Geofilum rubicundum]|uniref:Thiol:disulfide interchange protein n=1 Tax=Geofilum rubicundum JCM 15548 TaxID=1236989 RepID=A0A0E9M0U9_9BACT|nr:TlpA disulfide reductase family protein [Geofilum rubicundum]GAO31124.1 thiol:disulfide interchange protein [Geofilum rubicundum JCM 15548]